MTDTPAHYTGKNGIEPIDLIDAFELNFNMGNVVKYVCRAGRKTQDPTEDLGKALYYLVREMEAREARKK